MQYILHSIPKIFLFDLFYTIHIADWCLPICTQHVKVFKIEKVHNVHLTDSFSFQYILFLSYYSTFSIRTYSGTDYHTNSKRIDSAVYIILAMKRNVMITCSHNTETIQWKLHGCNGLEMNKPSNKQYDTDFTHYAPICCATHIIHKGFITFQIQTVNTNNVSSCVLYIKAWGIFSAVRNIMFWVTRSYLMYNHRISLIYFAHKESLQSVLGSLGLLKTHKWDLFNISVASPRQ